MLFSADALRSSLELLNENARRKRDLTVLKFELFSEMADSCWAAGESVFDAYAEPDVWGLGGIVEEISLKELGAFKVGLAVLGRSRTTGLGVGATVLVLGRIGMLGAVFGRASESGDRLGP